MPTSRPRVPRRGAVLAAALLLALSVSPLRSQDTRSSPPDWAAVDAAMGRTGVAQPGGVRRYAMPRSDLAVTVDGVRVLPSLALGSWLAMLPAGSGVMAMGDLVLTEPEVQPVLDALQAGGIEQSAIHHHLLGETPRVLYVHVHAMGDPLRIAQAMRAALARTATPVASPAPATATSAAPMTLDTAAITHRLGHAGRLSGGVWQVSVPRPERIRDGGVELPPSMGVATAINLEPAPNGAATTGDFVLRAGEVNPVIRALRAHRIAVTSVHNHLLADEPRLFFLHFWATGDATTLADGLRAALDHVAPAGTVRGN